MRGTSFEFCRKIGKCRLFDRDFSDHAAAELKRRHFLQQFLTPPQYAYSGRAQHFMPGKRVEIAPYFLHIYRHMRCSLRTVDENETMWINSLHFRNNFFNGIYRSQYVRDVRNSHEFSFLCDNCFEFRNLNFKFIWNL